MAQLAANAAEIAVLKAEKETLSQRIVKLEEELALARLHRFGPRSEKRADRVFNEAERVAADGETDGEDGADVDLPDTGLPPEDNPVPDDLHRHRSEARRLAARRAIMDRRKRQKAPGLRGVLRRASKPAKFEGGKITTQRDRQSHGEPPV